nr:YHYH protein [Bacteroidia bacterium]
VSTICNLYDADGLYVIDSTKHAPLIGFAYDGFPIYGAYAYKNVDGTGGIVRMKSSYTLRNITTRTSGPNVNANYPLGYFREDYQYNATSANTPDYLDEHNGRFCVTPEYPNGIYCYFATVDERWNSAYPYAVGPTFYGVKSAAKVNSITEAVTTYTPSTTSVFNLNEELNMVVFPNPSSEFIAVQTAGITRSDMEVNLYDMNGKLLERKTLHQGSTIAYFDVRLLYSGNYLLEINGGNQRVTKKIVLTK